MLIWGPVISRFIFESRKLVRFNHCYISFNLLLAFESANPLSFSVESRTFDWKQWSLGDDLRLILGYCIYMFYLVGYDLDHSKFNTLIHILFNRINILKFMMNILHFIINTWRRNSIWLIHYILLTNLGSLNPNTNKYK